MAQSELQKYRVRLFRDAENFRMPERVPYLSAAVTWKIFDAGFKPAEALTDFSVMETCVRHFLDNYPVDAVMDIGIRNQFNVTEAFGPGGYYYYTDEAIGIRDHAHCTVDTLQDYQNDPDRYLWEHILPEKYGEDWAKKDPATWRRAFKEYLAYVKFIIHMGSVTGKEYNLPSMAPNNPMKGAIKFGIEELESNLLGIRNLSVALRRSPDKLEDFVRRWDAEHIDPLIEKINASGAPNEKYCFDASMMMLAHNLLSPKQFDRFYWPSLKRLLDAYAAKGMSVRIFTEGEIGRFADYFRDYPKGALTFHVESDDLFALRERLPNVCLMGGLTTELLSSGTPEECVAYTKRLCDELGRKGGFILSENKMLSYRNDARSENLKAVCDFAAGYRL